MALAGRDGVKWFRLVLQLVDLISLTHHCIQDCLGAIYQ